MLDIIIVSNNYHKSHKEKRQTCQAGKQTNSQQDWAGELKEGRHHRGECWWQ